jgi:hypothetical protein
MEQRYKSSILLSIFKRKGREGVFTKIINDQNEFSYINLEEEEQAIIFYDKGENNWLLLTNNRVLWQQNEALSSLLYCNLLIISVTMAEEFKLGVMNKDDFTYLYLKDCKLDNYLLQLEEGQPYNGIYQVLHYIITINNSDKTKKK